MKKKKSEPDDRFRIRLTVKISIVLLFAIVISFAVVNYATHDYRMSKAMEEGGEIARHGCFVLRDYFINIDYPLEALDEDRIESVYLSNTIGRDVCRGLNLKYLYLYKFDKNYVRHYYFIVVAEESLQEKIEADFVGVDDANPLTDNEIAVLEGDNSGVLSVEDNEYGHVCTCVIKLGEKDGEIYMIGADCDMDMIYSQMRKDDNYLLIMGCAVSLVAFILMIILIRLWVLKPLGKLSVRMEGFAENRTIDSVGKKHIIRDEITDMEASFEKMAEELTGYISDVKQLTAEKVQADVQLDVARRIQNGMVPPAKEYIGRGCSVYAVMQPAQEVGGDFYDVFGLGQGKVGFVIGDVSGKGISAALFMSMARRILRERLRSGMQPAKALKRSNDEICRENPEGFFATVFAAVWDPDEGKLIFANAGHNPPILFGKRIEERQVRSGDLLGLFEDAEFHNETLLLEYGEGLLLYTDGVTEAVDAKGTPYGIGRLQEKLAGLQSEPEKISEIVKNDVLAFEREVGIFDDITLITFCRREEENITLSPDLYDLEKLKDYIFGFVEDRKLARKVMTAAEEWFVDVSSYSEASEVQLNLIREGSIIKAVFTDDGHPFDPTSQEQKEKTFEELDEGGMGITLIRKLASEFRYEWVDEKNVVTLVFLDT